LNGRFFLLEKVRYRDIQLALSSLPEQASSARGGKGASGLASVGKGGRLLTSSPTKGIKLPRIPSGKRGSHPMRLALGGGGNRGYVLDYVTLNASYTNFIWQGDTTYFLSGNVNLAGTNVYEWNSILKFSANSSITGVAGSAMVFRSQTWRPLVMTAKDDNSIGETISGSTGSPSGYYANPALNLSSMGSVALSNLRIAYANRGVSGGSPSIADAQLVNCGTAVSDINGTVTMENVLLSNNKTNFNATSSANTISAQNVTVNNAFDLVDGNFASTWFYLTNCVFVNATNLSGNITAAYNGFYQSPAVGASPTTNTFNPLQCAGAANCYLTNTCAFLNAGTTNISASLLADLADKTTYAPVIFSNLTFSVATNFSPHAQRDYIGSPSLGYHYDPLDYVLGASDVAASNLTFAAGTAVGWFYKSSGGTLALAVGDSATVAFNGTATAPCQFVKYSLVQEGNGNWVGESYLGAVNGQSYTHAAPAVTAQFTIVSAPATEASAWANAASSYVFNIAAADSEFYSSGVGGYYASINMTNCLFVNGAPGLWWNYGAANLTMQGCTCLRGNINADNTSGGAWPVTIFNCAFDSTTLYMNSHGGPTNGYYTDYNSFLANSNTTLYLGGHEITNLVSYNWETSWFGSFYLPTNSPLIQAGSTNANLLGLYHFTTHTNEVPETNAIVTIGYHYVATDTNGVPLDTNGDGVPDYLEDANGNGLVDSGEIGWNIVGDLGLSVTISKPRNGSSTP
jgi:hypothetical protein